MTVVHRRRVEQTVNPDNKASDAIPALQRDFARLRAILPVCAQTIEFAVATDANVAIHAAQRVVDLFCNRGFGCELSPEEEGHPLWKDYATYIKFQEDVEMLYTPLFTLSSAICHAMLSHPGYRTPEAAQRAYVAAQRGVVVYRQLAEAQKQVSIITGRQMMGAAGRAAGATGRTAGAAARRGLQAKVDAETDRVMAEGRIVVASFQLKFVCPPLLLAGRVEEVLELVRDEIEPSLTKVRLPGRSEREIQLQSNAAAILSKARNIRFDCAAAAADWCEALRLASGSFSAAFAARFARNGGNGSGDSGEGANGGGTGATPAGGGCSKGKGKAKGAAAAADNGAADKQPPPPPPPPLEPESPSSREGFQRWVREGKIMAFSLAVLERDEELNELEAKVAELGANAAACGCGGGSGSGGNGFISGHFGFGGGGRGGDGDWGGDAARNRALVLAWRSCSDARTGGRKATTILQKLEQTHDEMNKRFPEAESGEDKTWLLTADGEEDEEEGEEPEANGDVNGDSDGDGNGDGGDAAASKEVEKEAAAAGVNRKPPGAGDDKKQARGNVAAGARYADLCRHRTCFGELGEQVCELDDGGKSSGGVDPLVVAMHELAAAAYRQARHGPWADPALDEALRRVVDGWSEALFPRSKTLTVVRFRDGAAGGANAAELEDFFVFAASAAAADAESGGSDAASEKWRIARCDAMRWELLKLRMIRGIVKHAHRLACDALRAVKDSGGTDGEGTAAVERVFAERRRCYAAYVRHEDPPDDEPMRPKEPPALAAAKTAEAAETVEAAAATAAKAAAAAAAGDDCPAKGPAGASDPEPEAEGATAAVVAAAADPAEKQEEDPSANLRAAKLGLAAVERAAGLADPMLLLPLVAIGRAAAALDDWETAKGAYRRGLELSADGGGGGGSGGSGGDGVGGCYGGGGSWRGGGREALGLEHSDVGELFRRPLAHALLVEGDYCGAANQYTELLADAIEANRNPGGGGRDGGVGDADGIGNGLCSALSEIGGGGGGGNASGSGPDAERDGGKRCDEAENDDAAVLVMAVVKRRAAAAAGRQLTWLEMEIREHDELTAAYGLLASVGTQPGLVFEEKWLVEHVRNLSAGPVVKLVGASKSSVGGCPPFLDLVPERVLTALGEKTDSRQRDVALAMVAGHTLVNLKRGREAEAWLRRAIRGLQAMHGADDFRLGEPVVLLSRAAFLQGRTDDAYKILMRIPKVL